MNMRYPVLFCALMFTIYSVFAQEAEVERDTNQSGATFAEQESAPSEVEDEDGMYSETESAQKILDTLIIEGLSITRPHLVFNTVTLKQKSEFRSADIAESIRRLYALGLFRSIEFLIQSETETSASLILRLEEFPICENVEYSGNKKLKKDDFEEKVVTKRGQVISDAMVYDISQRLKKLYAEKGYNLAEINTELVPTKVPGNAILQIKIKEGPKVRIKEIVFKGNTEVKSSRLERKLKTKEKRWWRSGEYNEELYKEHLDTLLLFYNDLGFLDASIVSDSVYYGTDKKNLFIEITIDEGKKYYAGDFLFSGNVVIPSDTLQSRITLKKGKPFQKSQFEMSKYLVENVYREEGYLWVYVNEKRSFRDDTIDVTFDIAEGRAAIVRKIEITGNTKTMEKVIRREIVLYPGKKYRQSLMMRSRQKLMALQFFSDVKPDLLPNEDGTIDLVFDIVEKDNIGQLQVGAAYSGQGKFVGTFSTTIPNFRGSGQELGVNVSVGGRDDQNYEFSFQEPYAFDMPMSLSGKIFYKQERLSGGEKLKNYGFEIGVGRQQLKWPDNKFKIYGTYGISRNESSYKEEYIPEFDLEIKRKGYMNSFGLVIDRYDLDMPLFPTEGSRLTIAPEYVGFGVGEQYHFFKLTAEYKNYFPLPLKLVLGSRSKVGAISGLGNSIKISRQELFKLGGIYGVNADLRGYNDFEFGGLSSSPESGLTMFATTIDLSYPLLKEQLYLAVFADAGNTWSKVSNINLGDLYKSVGVGVRINIPMLGLLGFDFAWGLDDISNNLMDEKPEGYHWHFLMNKGF